jgi:[ribosomal protein S18]-alanine N-acetyltransferase
MVRTACPTDIPAMLEIERQCLTLAHWSESEYRRIFAPGGRARIALVWEEAGRILGFIIGAASARDWEVENVIVAEEHRRRGLGSGLLTEFFVAAKQQGAESVFLEVRESNGDGRNLYQNMGFVEAGRRRSYYSNPTEDAIVCRKTDL